MGALIQTKGTQRLANNFNSRFSNLATAGSWTSTGAVPKTFAGSLNDAFDKNAFDLLKISDSFIAQNATGGSWPADGNDVLYPSATMTTTAVSNNAVLLFNLPAGINALAPGSMITNGASAISLDKRGSIQNGTTVIAAPVVAAGAGGVFNVTVTLSQNVNNVSKGERINFSTGSNQRLVRRWRWYLSHDLKPENDNAIQNAISAALDDSDFKSIIFQTLEDTQRVVTSTEQQLDANNLAFINQFILHVILMTQKTTAPDTLDS
jgi:hypothetical protein